MVPNISTGTHLLEVGNKDLGDQLTEHDFGRINNRRAIELLIDK